MIKRLYLICLFLLFSTNSWAGVKAFVNQSTVYDGDPLQLTIEVDRNTSDKPDLSVLEQDFVIQSTGQSTNFSMVNGNTSYTKSWNIQLMPRGRGKLVIPAISLGGEMTQPITIQVADLTPELVAENQKHVIVEASIDPEMSLPYVQQQIPYTLKLLTDETVRSGDLYAPNIENAVIEQISGDKQYQISRNGKRFDVLERHYAILPEKSGKLLIPPALFKGAQVIPDTNRRSRSGGLDNFFNDPFFNDPFFSNSLGAKGKSITNRSEEIEVDVQPIPDDYKGKTWLPAEDLVVLDNWDSSLPTFKVGEPALRTLSLQVKGLAGSQIPEFTVPSPEKMRVYPDQAKTDTKTDGSKLYGLRDQSLSYIPNEAGKIVIPALSIDWWNVLEKKHETFVLPERTIEVLPGVGGKSSQDSSSQIASAPAASPNEESENLAVDSEESGGSYLPWLMLPLLLLGGYFLYQYFNKKPALKTKKQASKPTADFSDKAVSKSQLLNKLQQACEANDNAMAAQSLLELAQLDWPGVAPKNLGTLAASVETGGQLIQQLDRSLYADHANAWQGADLWEVFKNGVKPIMAGEKGSAEVVASLYPDRA